MSYTVYKGGFDMKDLQFLRLQNRIKDCLKIDENNVEKKCLDLSTLNFFIQKQYNIELKKLKLKSIEKDKIFGSLYDKFKYHFDYKLDSKAEIEVYVKSDDKYISIAQEIVEIEIQVNFLEKMLDQINQAGFRINNYTNLKKIRMGMM